MERPPRQSVEYPSADQLQSLYLKSAEALIKHGSIKDVDLPEAQWPDRPQPHMFEFDVPADIAGRILELDEVKERVIRCRMSFAQEAVIDEEMAPEPPFVFWSIDTLVTGPTGEHLVKTQWTSLQETSDGYQVDTDVDYAELANLNRRINALDIDDPREQLQTRTQPFTADEARRFQKLADWLLAS